MTKSKSEPKPRPKPIKREPKPDAVLIAWRTVQETIKRGERAS